jgi:hypothetical protein
MPKRILFTACLVFAASTSASNSYISSRDRGNDATNTFQVSQSIKPRAGCLTGSATWKGVNQFHIVVTGSLTLLSAHIIRHIHNCALQISIQPRIIGGEDATSNRFPYVADLDYSSGSHACMGSLVAPDFILTAGHCA